MKSTVLSGLVCVLVLNMGLASGLDCYQCKKVGSEGPDEDCDADTIMPEPAPCPPGTGVPFCTRISSEPKEGGAGVGYLIRGCEWFPEATVPICVAQTLPFFGGIYEYCICNETSCNGAGNIAPTTTTPKTTTPSHAPQIGIAHFSLPIIGLALRQVFVIL